MKKEQLLLISLVLMCIVMACGGSVAPKDNPDPIYTQAAEPTPTIQPTLDTSTVEEYAALQSIKMTLCGESSTTVGLKFTEISQNIDLFNDPGYIAGVQESIDEFELFCTMFYEENFPPEMNEINNLLNEVDINYIQAAIHMRAGFDAVDADKLNTALTYMNAGTAKMEEATSLIENSN